MSDTHTLGITGDVLTMSLSLTPHRAEFLLSDGTTLLLGGRGLDLLLQWQSQRAKGDMPLRVSIFIGEYLQGADVRG